MSDPARPRRHVVKAWIGFVDGKPDFYVPSLTTGHCGRPSVADLFRSRRAARREYEDVRRATVVIEEGASDD